MIQLIFISSHNWKISDLVGSEICDEDRERRLKLAEGHVEVGRLLAFYQVYTLYPST